MGAKSIPEELLTPPKQEGSCGKLRGDKTLESYYTVAGEISTINPQQRQLRRVQGLTELVAQTDTSVANLAKGFHQPPPSPSDCLDGCVVQSGCVQSQVDLENSLGARGICNTPFSVGQNRVMVSRGAKSPEQVLSRKTLETESTRVNIFQDLQKILKNNLEVKNSNFGTLGKSGPVAESTSNQQSSWSGSQLVNDALAQFQAQARQNQENAFSSVSGEDLELNFSERQELEALRTMFASMNVQQPSNMAIGNFGNQQNVADLSFSGLEQNPYFGNFGGQGNQLRGPNFEGNQLAYQPVVSSQPIRESEQAKNSDQENNCQENISGCGSSQQFLLGDVQPLQESQLPNQVPIQISARAQEQPTYSRCVPIESRGVPIGEGFGGTASQQPTLVPKEIKLQKPATFSGNKAEVDNFIFQMKSYIDSVELGTNGSACRFVVSYLKGDALTWWRSFSKDNLQIYNYLELDVLLDEIKAHFSDIDEENKLLDKILNVKQTSTVAQYVSSFKRFQLKLGQQRLPDSIALHVFLVGLKTYTRKQVMLQRPTTVEDAILLAERAEQSLYWSRTNYFPGSRQFYPDEQYNTTSQYGDSRYKGPAPMVLGNV